MSALQEALREIGAKALVRNLRHGETMPEDLRVGFAHPDPEWTWVAVSHGRIVAALLATPCHGIVMLVRLVVKPGNGWIMLRLCRKFVEDVILRGYSGYILYANRDRKEERKLTTILAKTGATLLPQAQLCLGGTLADLARW